MPPPLHILLADDEEIVHRTLADYLVNAGHQVDDALDGKAALKLAEENDYDLALLDVRMPGMDGLSLLDRIQETRPDTSVVIITGHGDMATAVQALRSGAADLLTKPIDLLELDAALEKASRVRSLRRDKRRLRDTITTIQEAQSLGIGNTRLTGASPATQRAREQIRQAVEAQCATILLSGETGVGKEVAAREIHAQAEAASGSPDEGPFIAVSCPALPETLAESALFGHVKGAFTGADADRAGYFEAADGGTLFLDEIADLSAPVQATLLRALEARTIFRIGSAKEVRVDIRIIAATNRDLKTLVESGTFRDDLFHRLNVFTIRLLPLRERREDIVPLAEHFLSTYAAARDLHSDGFSSEAKALLADYDYPGNARELRNLVERAAILCREGQIQAQHIVLGEPTQTAPTGEPPEAVEDDERTRITKALDQARWNRRQAAELLSMPYSTLHYKIKRLGIK